MVSIYFYDAKLQIIFDTTKFFFNFYDIYNKILFYYDNNTYFMENDLSTNG